MPNLAMGRDWKLWYRHPARDWEEALPVGNGRIGGMVFGGVDRERISLNEESIWSGSPKLKKASNVHQEVVKRQQALLFEGKYKQASEINAANVPEGFRVHEEVVEGTSGNRHIYKRSWLQRLLL